MPSFIVKFMSSFQQLSFLLLSTLLINACGGGSESGGDGLSGISDNLTFPIINITTQNDDGAVEVSITVENEGSSDTGDRELTVQLQTKAVGVVGSLNASSQLSSNTIVATNGAAKFFIYQSSVQGNGTFVLSALDDDGSLLTSEPQGYSILGVTTTTVDPDVIPGIPVITGLKLVQQDDGATPLGTIANPITDSNPGFIQATLTVDGSPLANKLVSFTSTLGQLASATGLTNDTGLVQVGMTSGTLAGAGTVELSVTEGDETVTSNLDFQTSGSSSGPTGPTDSLLLAAEICKGGSDANLGGCDNAPAIGGAIYGDGNDPLNDADGWGYITALLTDNASVPQAGVLLEFGLTAGGVLLTDSGITDVNGLVVVRVAPGAVPGAGALTISTKNASGQGDVSQVLSIQTQGDGDAEPSIFDITLSILDAYPGGNVHGGSGSPITSGIPGFVIANISSTSGNEADVLVTFSVSNESGMLTQTTSLTSSIGDAVVQLNPGTVAGAGTITATFELGEETLTETINFESSVSESTTDTISLGVDWGQADICEDLNDDGAQDDPAYSSLAIYIEDKGNPNRAITDPCQASGANAFNTNTAGPIRELKTGVTAIVKVQVYNETTSLLFSDPIEVVFSSLCAELGKATLGSVAATTSTVTSVSGTATTTYLADGCVGEDTITATASVGGDNLAAQVTFDIETPAVSSIEFLSAQPQVLALKGTGGANRVETSVIQYRVVGTDGNPSANRNVYVALSNQPGGVTLDTNLATSNADGIVEVTVNSGTVSGTLRVRAIFDVDEDDLFDASGDAIVDADDIVVFSDELSISSGLADADGIHISVSSLNPESWNVSNVPVQVTASLNDRGGENVAIGTAVFFRSEFGRIGDEEGDAVCYTDITGSCSVTWFSNGREDTEFLHFDPTPGNGLGKPGGNSFAIDYDRRGRNVIYASTQGEETFVDIDGDNVFDPTSGDIFLDIGEFFFDFNENGRRELGDGTFGAYLEPYQEFNGDGIQNLGNGLYDGVSCSEAAIVAGHCSDLVNVHSSLTLISSGSSARIFMANDLANLEHQGFVNSSGEPDWRASDTGSLVINTSDATDDIYQAVTASGGSGTGLSLDLIVEGGTVVAFNESNSGSGYVDGDTLTISSADIGGSTDLSFTYPVIIRPLGPTNSVNYGGDTDTQGILYVMVTDENGNSMPEGTTVTADGTGLVGIPTDNETLIIGPSTEPFISSFPVIFSDTIDGDGTVRVSVTSPAGIQAPAELFTFTAPLTTGDCHSVHFSTQNITISEPVDGSPDVNVTMDIEIAVPVFSCTEDIQLTYFVTGSSVGDHEFSGISDSVTAAVTALPGGSFTLKFSESYRATVSFDVSGDPLFEGPENVSIFLGIDPNDTSGAILGPNNQFTLIVNNT